MEARVEVARASLWSVVLERESISEERERVGTVAAQPCREWAPHMLHAWPLACYGNTGAERERQRKGKKRSGAKAGHEIFALQISNDRLEKKALCADLSFAAVCVPQLAGSARSVMARRARQEEERGRERGGRGVGWRADRLNEESSAFRLFPHRLWCRTAAQECGRGARRPGRPALQQLRTARGRAQQTRQATRPIAPNSVGATPSLFLWTARQQSKADLNSVRDAHPQCPSAP